MVDVTNIKTTDGGEAVAPAAAEAPVGPITCPGGKGRTLTLERPGVLAPYDLMEVLGPETAVNEAYVQMVFPLLYLKAIDQEQLPMFQTKMQMKSLIQRLDHEGMIALSDGVRKHFARKPDAIEGELSSIKK